MAQPQSSLDFEQVLKDVHDEAASSLRVNVVAGGGGNQDVIVKNSLVPEEYDYIGAAYPTSTQEVYTYKAGGAGGTTVATVTVIYVDSTKEQLVSVART